MKTNKIKVTLETQEKLTKKELAAIKQAIAGQLVKKVDVEGQKMGVNQIEALCHVDPIHTPPMMT